jgi:conjugal transfer pilus assembly protein TraF
MRCLSALVFILFSAQVSSEALFYQKKAEGWFWYEELKKEELQEPEHLPIPNPLLDAKPLTPTEQILEQRKILEQKLHQAIVLPSLDNIKDYLYVQRALMDQSQRFAENWQKVLLHAPDLDEIRIHPVNQAARHLYLASNQQSKTEKLQQLSKEYGLFFFFKGKCLYCQAFAETLKHFSEKYAFSLLPISLDGQMLNAFPQFQNDNGLAEQFNIATVPAVIALHTKTKEVIPLSFKMISLSELEFVANKMLGAAP